MDVTETTAVLRGFHEIADFTGLSLPSVKALVRDGELPHFCRDGTVCADRSAVVAWAKAKYGEARPLD